MLRLLDCLSDIQSNSKKYFCSNDGDICTFFYESEISNLPTHHLAHNKNDKYCPHYPTRKISITCLHTKQFNLTKGSQMRHAIWILLVYNANLLYQKRLLHTNSWVTTQPVMTIAWKVESISWTVLLHIKIHFRWSSSEHSGKTSFQFLCLFSG